MKNGKIHVLVIDDSFFMRKLISDMLNSDPEIEVLDTAKNGEEAIDKLSKIKPDCITLDLMMPGRGGLNTLKHIMSEFSVPVIILSAHSRADADITIECLNEGAVGFVLKPSGELSLDIDSVKCQLLREIKAAARIDPEKIKPKKVEKQKRLESGPVVLNKIIVIGASTGGPQTLKTVLLSLPVNFSIPIVIAQHTVSIFFSESLARHLKKTSGLEVKVAENGEVIQNGRVYLAPAGFRMKFKSQKKNVTISLDKAEHGSLTPSVDITMTSAAEIYGQDTVGIILTGMGYDGLEGMRAIKAAGGKTVVQDESSLIFGMPKAVIDAGLADKVLPAEKIAKVMMELT